MQIYFGKRQQKHIISTSCFWQHPTAVSLPSSFCPVDPHGYHKLSAKLCPASPCPRAIYIIITLPFFGLKLERCSCHMYNPEYITQIKVQAFLIKQPCDNTAADFSTSMNLWAGQIRDHSVRVWRAFLPHHWCFLPPRWLVAHWFPQWQRAIAGDHPFPYAGCTAPSLNSFLLGETPKRACHTSLSMQWSPEKLLELK